MTVSHGAACVPSQPPAFPADSYRICKGAGGTLRELAGLGEDLETGLISYWKLGGASPLADSFGSNDLTAVGTPTQVAGTIGEGTELDGLTESLYVLDDASLSLGADTSFAAGGWIKADTIPTGAASAIDTFFHKGNGTLDFQSAYKFALDGDGGGVAHIRFAVGNGTLTEEAVVHSSVSFGTGEWLFVYGWYDAMTQTVGIYVNGTADTVSHANGTHDDTGPVIFGAVGGGTPPGTPQYDGIVDEFFFYKNVVHTQAQRDAIYNAGSGSRPHFLIARAYAIGGTSNLLGYWPLQETSGTTAYDISGNAAHGTYRNSPTMGDSGTLYTGDVSVHFNDAASQDIEIGSALTLGSDTATVMALAAVDNIPSGIEHILAVGNVNEYIRLWSRLNTGTIRAAMSVRDGAAGPATEESEAADALTAGDWYFLVGRQETNLLRNIHIDAVQSGADETTDKGIDFTSADAHIASQNGNAFWDGKLQHVALFDSVVSDADLTLLQDAITESGLDN